LNGNTCLTTCPDGKWENPITKICDPCTSPCKNCDLNGTDCLSCVSGTFYLSANKACPTTCPSG